MKRAFIFLFLILSNAVAFSQGKFLGIPSYANFGAGFTIGEEHGMGLPKIILGIQSGKKSCVYLQAHFATALGFTGSPGIESGVRFWKIGAGYSISFFGTDQNHRFYKWTHNINLNGRIGPIMLKIGTPIHYGVKGIDFETRNKFVTYKGIPLNFELLFFISAADD